MSSGSALEFEVIDVCASKDCRLAKQDRILLDELELSEAARLHKPGFWVQCPVQLRLGDVTQHPQTLAARQTQLARVLHDLPILLSAVKTTITATETPAVPFGRPNGAAPMVAVPQRVAEEAGLVSRVLVDPGVWDDCVAWTEADTARKHEAV